MANEIITTEKKEFEETLMKLAEQGNLDALYQASVSAKTLGDVIDEALIRGIEVLGQEEWINAIAELVEREDLSEDVKEFARETLGKRDPSKIVTGYTSNRIDEGTINKKTFVSDKCVFTPEKPKGKAKRFPKRRIKN